MENKPVEAMHPRMDVDQAVASGMDGTLNLDAQPTTRAISRPRQTLPRDRADVRRNLHGKAGDVPLGVEGYVGPETYRQGVHYLLQRYLCGERHRQRSVTLTRPALSHKPVNKIMESLIAQAGVPLVTLASHRTAKSRSHRSVST